MEAPRWLADEMLGRLARYLRVLGHDTAYARGVPDAEIAFRAREEHRRLITRDRDLASRVPGSLLLSSVTLADQLRQVMAERPGLSGDPTFDRCTLCNGPLAGDAAVAKGRFPPGEDGPGTETARWRCRDCGHVYWEGSHTARMRQSLRQWLAPESGR
ncbi:MAG TPA: Mut7-C RNAse domain-containing protein [Thermoplasmata archaeon]|nr:Mut7-C RNAse domain-containing protein [Thermoplasmata archaeon]